MQPEDPPARPAAPRQTQKILDAQHEQQQAADSLNIYRQCFDDFRDVHGWHVAPGHDNAQTARARADYISGTAARAKAYTRATAALWYAMAEQAHADALTAD